MKLPVLVLVLGLLVLGCTSLQQAQTVEITENEEATTATEVDTSVEIIVEESTVATFAGGCFWCTEADFEKVEGVLDVVSGFAGGVEQNPTYKEVAGGSTSHTEAVQLTFDSNVVSYEYLLAYFWRHHNPTDVNGQFVDRGKQYRPAIFYHDEKQRELAEQSKMELEYAQVFDKPILTEITEFSSFFEAEDYHQDYHTKNPLRYAYYRHGSGRDQFLESVWGENLTPTIPKVKTSEPVEQEQIGDYSKPSDEELRELLTPLQYRITQEDGTEQPFDNEYWDNKEEGIYVDIVSGEPLFSSTDKYVSGTGWPSFTKPLEPDNIVEKTDYKLIYPRTEIRSKQADSHLGHLFDDGPQPTGDRYCMNSAALRFVPVADLEEEGYGKYMHLFS